MLCNGVETLSKGVSILTPAPLADTNPPCNIFNGLYLQCLNTSHCCHDNVDCVPNADFTGTCPRTPAACTTYSVANCIPICSIRDDKCQDPSCIALNPATCAVRADCETKYSSCFSKGKASLQPVSGQSAGTEQCSCMCRVQSAGMLTCACTPV